MRLPFSRLLSWSEESILIPLITCKGELSVIMATPCETCPYRKDVASGIWHPSEYAKLPLYDRPTAEQPAIPFACHAAPQHYCHGWAVCHSNRGHENDLLALRIVGFREEIEVPPPAVPLFESGAAAAIHGMKGVKRPGKKAQAAIGRLLKKHERLRKGSE